MIYQIISLIETEFEKGLHELLAKYRINDRCNSSSGWEFAKHYVIPVLLGLKKSTDLNLIIVETAGYANYLPHPHWKTLYNYKVTNQIFYTPSGIKYAMEKGNRILSVVQGNKIDAFYSLYSDKPTLILCSDEMIEAEKTVLQLLIEVIPDAKQIKLSKLCECLDKTFEFRKKKSDLLLWKQKEHDTAMNDLENKTEEALIEEISEALK